MTSDTSLPVILIHIGARMPYALASVVEQALATSPGRRVVLVTDHPHAFRSNGAEVIDLSEILPSDEMVSFRQLDYSTSTFRSGFWLHAMTRLFVLHDAMQSLGIQKAIHLENDVLLLTSPALERRLRDSPAYVYLPFASRARGIASLVYVGGIEALTEVLQHLLQLINATRLPSEMEYLAAAAAAGAPIRSLPTMPSNALQLSEPSLTHEGLVPSDAFWSGYPQFGAIFDATALGHYLAGPDPANDRYLSRNLFISIDTNVDTPSLRWHLVEEQNQLRLQVSHQGALLDVANLHMHSKTFPPLTAEHLSWWRDRIGAANQQRRITGFEACYLLQHSLHSPRNLAHFTLQWAVALRASLR
jgi:hypothetical protein